jgi:Family of unknown function (DUF6463)
MVNLVTKLGFSMKYWIGKWIVAVSIIHTIFAFVVFPEVISQIFHDGVFNSIGVDPLRGAVVWFILFGFVLFALGLATNIIEEMSNGDVPSSIGFSLLFVIFSGVVLMPISGFWLALPPALIIIYKRYKLSNI